MAQTYTSILLHCVFSTRNRARLITPELRERLAPYMGGIARENGMRALAVGGTEDHMHLLLSLPATMSASKALQLVKGGSSKWVHDNFRRHGDFGWQQGYGAFSIGVSGVSDTVSYIHNQEAHHRGSSFEQEYRTVLNRHGIIPDERHVFD